MMQLIFFTYTGFCEIDHKNYTTDVKKGLIGRGIRQISTKT
jgi:hypothetical protein